MSSRLARLLFYGASGGCSRRLYSRGTSLLAFPPCKSVFPGLSLAVSPSLLSRRARLISPKCMYSTSQEGGDGDGDGDREAEGGNEETKDAEEESDSTESEDSESLELLPSARHHALATIRVPDHFPDVPLLPITRSPIFPRLARMLEAGASGHV